MAALFTFIIQVINPLGRSPDHLEIISTKANNLASEGLSAAEITTQIFARESRMAFLTGGHYSIQNLIDQVLAS